MERVRSIFNLAVAKIRGNDENEMYKNYINDLPPERIAYCLATYFERGSLKTKDDFKAAQVREKGNSAYGFKNCKQSIALYTKSLRYATYNGAEYALALANRSAAYFFVNDYKSCIQDIHLCLQANYTNHLKPKVYIRKARCFQRLGDSSKMRRTLVDALNIIDGLSSKFRTNSEKYKDIIKDLITAAACQKPVAKENFEVLPVLESNPMFLNASASIMLKYNKRRGYHVVAKKEIAVGDVLFVEKAYAFTPVCISNKIDANKHCQFCLLELKSCVPCKTCVKHLYCTENCRDSAWNEFHQWECSAVQAGFSTCCGNMAFRIILKTVHKGFSTGSIHYQDAVIKYGDKDNNYPYVYNLSANIGKIKQHHLMLYTAAAALLVNYLKLKTNFFQKMKQTPEYAKKSDAQLMSTIGGLIVRHCCQGHCHNVPVWDYDNDYYIPEELTIANAICPSMTMMSHSCIPNTSHYFVGDTVVVKATKNIKTDEDICYSYGGVPFSALEKHERQDILQTMHFFKCNCKICTDPKMDAHNSYMCVKCKGPTSLVNTNIQFAPQQYVCLDCSYKFLLPTNIALKERLVPEYFIRFQVYHNADDADRCLELCKTIYRPLHPIFESLYTERKEYYRITGDAKGFIENGMLLLDYLEEKRNAPAVKVGRDSYTYCVTALDILKSSALKISLQEFREVLTMLLTLVEKAKAVFDLYHAPFIARLRPVEKLICAMQDIYASRVTNEK